MAGGHRVRQEGIEYVRRVWITAGGCGGVKESHGVLVTQWAIKKTLAQDESASDVLGKVWLV